MIARRRMLGAFTLLAPLASACTSLQTHKLSVESAQAPQSGSFVYSLPRTSFVVTGTLTLNGCGAVDADGKGHYRPSLDLSETFVITPIVEADPQAQYAIPYDKLRTWMKEINVTVTSNANKSLGGVNATINDQAGPVAMAAVLAGLKIAGGLSIPAEAHAQQYDQHMTLSDVIPGGRALPPPPTYCTDDVLKALKQIDTDNGSISTQSAADADKKATTPSPSIAKWQSEIVQLRRDYALVRTFTVRWTPSFQTETGRTDGDMTAYTKPVDVFTPLIRPWLSGAGRGWYDTAANAEQTGYHAVHDPLEVRLGLKTWTMGTTKKDTDEKTMIPVVPDAKGLVVRDPALGELRLCRNTCTAEAGLAETTSDLAAPANVTAPQFGRYQVLPLQNGPFENSNLALTLNADGSIASLGNHSTGTLAAGLGVAGQAGDQLATNQAARNTATTASNTAAIANEAAVDTANKNLVDCLTQQAAVTKAGGTPIGHCQ